MGHRKERLQELVKSPEGKNLMTFLVFLVISAILWIVMALNEESQRDLPCTIKIVNVPDSIMRVTPMPEKFNVGVRSRGTALLKYVFSKDAIMNIDYRNYASKYTIKLDESSLKAFFRARIGSDAQIISVSPDSLVVHFTSSQGLRVPVKVNAHVVPGPQYAIIGDVRSLTDSVTVYSLNPDDNKIKSISTAPIVLNNVRSSQTLKVALSTKPNMRAVPDSVEVHIDVEPLVAKTRSVKITPVNVPADYRLITVPAEAEVYYMVPMSTYKSADSNPDFAVKADYSTINEATSKIAVSLTSAPKDFLNVFLELDSVEFYLEKKVP